MFRSRRLWIVAVLAVISLLTAAYSIRHHLRYGGFAPHDRGMVYRAGRLEPDVVAELIETHQFRTVVGLCDPQDPQETSAGHWSRERRAVEQAGATWVLMPLPASIAADDPSVAQAIDVLRDPDNYPVLVYCPQGVARTATFLVMYDVLFCGMAAEDSLRWLPLPEQDRRDGNVRAFAQEFERRHGELYPTASADDLKILR